MDKSVPVASFPDVRHVQRHGCGCVTGFDYVLDRYITVAACPEHVSEMTA